MALYDDMDSVPISERLPLINDKGRLGSYVLECEDILSGKGGKKNSEFVKTVWTVVEAEGATSYKPGDRIAHVLTENEYGYHIKDLRNEISALCNVPQAKITKSMVDQLMDSDTPAHKAAVGTKVRAVVAPKTPGGTFSVVQYAPF